MNPWIVSLRLRTLPLAIAVISTGAILAFDAGAFRWEIYVMALLTTILLQILSNLANEYGDFDKGTDNDDRQGPIRSMQDGAISQSAMLRAMILSAVLSFLSGLYLLYVSSDSMTMFWSFLGFGVLAIAGAVYYTFGDSAYGYKGLGDISVLLFFGLLGVAGTYYLFAKSIDTLVFLPATTVGLFITAVLNVNNVRDMENDKASGKITIPVRLGKSGAIIYHYMLLVLGLFATIVFTYLQYQQPTDWLFILVSPLLIINAIGVTRHAGTRALDPKLKQMVLTTLLFVILFSIGILLR